MLKHVSNFFLQIFPSVVATVVGAYIVTNYINAKPAADAAKAAVASTADPAKDVAPKAETPADDADKAKASEKTPDKTAEKPAPEPKRQASREKPSEKPKAAPAPVVMSGPAAPAPVTVAVAPSAPAASDPAPASENRDANELARAALDRLRGPVEATKQPDTPKQPEAAKQPEPQRQATPTATTPAARAPEQPKVATATPVQPQVQQSIQPLPPAMLVTAPSNGQGPRNDEANAHKPREAAKDERSLSSFRPPGEIPMAPPLDLRAAGRADTSIADDVVATAKSVFHAVIPR